MTENRINISISKEDVALLHNIIEELEPVWDSAYQNEKVANMKRLAKRMVTKANKKDIWYNFQKIDQDAELTVENIKKEWICNIPKQYRKETNV